MRDSVVELDRDLCISCMKCAEACPFGAMFAHEDVDTPIKCDMCGGNPKCVANCPKGAIQLIPEQALGESKRMSNVLSYAHMKEIEYMEKGEKKVIRYAEIGKEEL
jgi:Fe-S-cluster-containing hydrogenase component 2